ncbi:MAG: VWA domain-containing protein [candidate division WOR-3 bacterium]|jgi:Ca-activated chloride channel family protein
MLHFNNPYYIFGLILLPLFYFLKRKRKSSSILYSDISSLGIKPAGELYTNLREYLILSIMALTLIGLARPQKGYETEIIHKKGIDIILAMDISGSMKAADFKPNRLEKAKELAAEFVDMRSGDRIGLVVFAQEALIQAPLTLDHDLVKEQIESLEFDLLPDGTAIGMGITYGNFLLSNSTSKNKIIILLTDGRNNAGNIDPETAAKNSLDSGIKIYAIGIGERGEVPYPVQNAFGITRYVKANFEINEEILTRIADETGGEYFRATSGEALKNIYKTIDQMEKTIFKVEKLTKYKEKLHFVLIPALILFMIIFIEPVIERRIP